MVGAVAPVRERQVIVDPHHVDRRLRPELVHVEDDVARAVVRPVRVVFAPVRGIGDRAAEDRAHIVRERAELVDRGIGPGPGPRPHGGQPDELGADGERVGALLLGQLRIVQDHRPEAFGAGEERLDLGRRGRGLVDRAGVARRRRAGDAPPPREHRLAVLRGIVAVGVGQIVARGDVHDDEGIEHDPLAVRPQEADRLAHGRIRRRAAEIRPSRPVLRDHLRRRAGIAGDRPFGGLQLALAVLHLRARSGIGRRAGRSRTR